MGKKKAITELWVCLGWAKGGKDTKSGGSSLIKEMKKKSDKIERGKN